MKKSLLIVFCLGITLNALGGGFQLNSQGIKAMSLGGSIAGHAFDATSVFHNPASISFLDKNYVNVFVGARLVNTTFLASIGGQEETENLLQTPYGLFAAYKLKGKFSLGLSVNKPFAYRNKWEDSWSGRFITIESKLAALHIQPTLSYQINDHFSIGGAPIISLTKQFDTKAIPVESQNTESQTTAEMLGKGVGYGYNVGAYLKFDKLSIGIDYRSSIKNTIENGELSYNNMPISQIESGIYPASSGYTSELKLPSVLTAGFGYQYNDNLLFIADFNFVGWEVYDSTVNDFDSELLSQEVQYHNCKNSISVNLGTQIKTNSNWEILLGVRYSQTPVKDGYLTPKNTDASRVSVSGGFSYKLKKALSLEGSLVLGNSKERKESNNLQSNFNGTYKTFNYLAGIGLQYAF